MILCIYIFCKLRVFWRNLFASKTAFADFFYKYQVWPSSPHYRHQYYHDQGHHILFMFLSPWCIVVKRAGATAGEVWRREGASPPTMGETSDLVWSVIHKRSLSFQSEYNRLFEKPLRKLCWSSFIQYQQAMYSQPKRDHPSIHTVTHQEGQMWWSHGLLKMMSVQGSCQKAGQITGQTSLL